MITLNRGRIFFFSSPLLSPDVVGVGLLSDDWEFLVRELILGLSWATSVRLSSRPAEWWRRWWWWCWDVSMPVDKTDKSSWNVLMEIDFTRRFQVAWHTDIKRALMERRKKRTMFVAISADMGLRCSQRSGWSKSFKLGWRTNKKKWKMKTKL